VSLEAAELRPCGLGAGGAFAPTDPRWTEWGGDGPDLHLAHGNGFPPGTYRQLANALIPRCRVVSFAARPLWPGTDPAEVTDWCQLAGDLEDGLRGRGLERVLGLGHSLGAVVSALAAARAPGLFSALVLVDPVLFTGARALLWGAARALGLRGRLPLIRATRRRRVCWPDRGAVQAAWSRLPLFRRWDPAVLDDYVDSGTVAAPGGGLVLRYPREWEARVFELAPHDIWAELGRLEMPTLVVRGALSTTFTAAAAERFAREVRDARVVEVPGATHFLPMERPAELARLALGFLASLG
jgi:pimeloyl-ACP methyl ester carboxylesterase